MLTDILIKKQIQIKLIHINEALNFLKNVKKLFCSLANLLVMYLSLTSMVFATMVFEKFEMDVRQRY